MQTNVMKLVTLRICDTTIKDLHERSVDKITDRNVFSYKSDNNIDMLEGVCHTIADNDDSSDATGVSDNYTSNINNNAGA